MSCDKLSGDAGTIQLNRLDPVTTTREAFNITGTISNSPKYQFTFDVAIPENATRIQFSINGVQYTVFLGCVLERAQTSLLDSLDINTLNWQSDNTVRAAFNGAPDLSSLQIGDFIEINGSTNIENDGKFVVTAIDDTGKTIDYINPSISDATNDEATDALGIAEIFDGKILTFNELPVGWHENLPCGEEIVLGVEFLNCSEDECCGSFENPVKVDSGVWNLDEYSPADVDDSVDPQYFGFITINSDWYVLKVDGVSYTYAFPSFNETHNNYQDAWTNRATLSYREFDQINN